MKSLLKTLCLLVAAVGVASAFAQQRPTHHSGLLNRVPRPGGMMRPGARAAQQQQAAAKTGATLEERLKDVPRGTNGVPTMLAFDQAPIELLLQAYAEAAGLILLPAPNLPKTQITLNSPKERELTKEEYLEAIEVTLTMNGVVLEPFDKIFLRAFERKSVRTQGIRTLLHHPGANGLAEKGRVVSQLIRLENIAAAEAQKAIEGFKDPNGLFQVFERTNAILVTDTQENINRMLEVIKVLDVANPVLEDVFVRQVKFAVATDIKTALETIVTESQKESQQANKSGPKESGGPGFARAAPSPTSGSLLNLNRRPGLNQPPPANTPNAALVAQVSDADRGMIRGKVLILADERSNKLIVITMKSNMDFFDKVIETLDVETEPEFKVEVVRLKYADAEDVESMLNDLIGGTSSSSSSKENKNQTAKNAGNTKTTLSGGAKTPAATGGAKKTNANQGSVGDLNKDNCKVLADKRINGIVVMTRKELMPVVMRVIDDMDVKLSQVLIETLIIEVTLGDDLKTGVDWVQRGRTTSTRQATDSYGRKLYWKSTTGDDGTETMTQTTENTGVAVMESYLARDGFVNHNNYMLGGGSGNASSTLQSMMAAGTNLVEGAAWGGANPIGGGVNYFLKSDKLNIAAVIQASKTDSRAKYVASPIVMTVDNKEASVEATSSRQFLTGWQAVSSSYAGSGMPSPNYSQKDIGITLKMTPKINPNGTIMLTVEEEYSQVSEKQYMMTPEGSTYVEKQIDVPATRKMSSDVRLENRQTVVLGGLVEKTTSESESGVPLLKDIPWIGKWLFGSVTQSEARKELLIFLTPYVLDDESAAQFEALRRKKALSDPRPWDDNGWSASPLADPVSKKEKLRRFQDEWKKQDEERKSKLAIEKAKVERARALKKMTKEEREAWVEIHKAELEGEAKEAFEKEAKEQKDLKEFVEGLKKKDLQEAESELKAAETAEKNTYREELERMKKEGKPLPAGETLRKDAEKLPESEAKPAAPAPAPAKAETPASAPAKTATPAPSQAATPAPAPAATPASTKALSKNNFYNTKN